MSPLHFLGRLRLLASLLAFAALPACAATDLDTADSTDDDDETQSEDELRAVLGTRELDADKPVRVLLVGDSAKLGDLTVHSALARARRYQEAFPDEQIVVYLPDEATNRTAARFGLRVVPADYAKMRGQAIITSLLHFKAIVSIDFYGHSGPFGVSLDSSSGDTNLRLATPNLAALGSRFARDRNPSVTFNGCNSGLQMAAGLAKMWNLPVAGAFTGTNFEQLHLDGHWYADLPGQVPSRQFATTNSESYSTDVACNFGGCVRMRPTNTPYSGSFGNFGRGLGHFKFFCSGDTATCEKGMAASLLGFPSVRPLTRSSTREDFEAVVLDYLCPTSADKRTFEECAARLPEAARNGTGYTPFSNPAKAVECDLRGCDARFTCKSDSAGYVVPGTCTVEAPPAPAQSRTTPREYISLMNGFERIRTR